MAESNLKEVQSGLWMNVFRRLKKNKAAMFGLFIVALIIFFSVTAKFIAPYDPLVGILKERHKAPSMSHLMGTDSQGRDVLSRVLHGSKISLEIGIISVGIALIIGSFMGIIAGFYRKRLESIIMGIVDIMLAFPTILLALAIVSILGRSLTNAMIAVGVVNIPKFARLIRASVLSIKETEYIEAARVIGCTDFQIVKRHILPNCIAPILVQTTMTIGTAILEAAGLSFLGLGAQPPSPEWGAMLADASGFMRQAPWSVMFPGVVIMLTVLGFNLLGDGLRDALDPKLKQ